MTPLQARQELRRSTNGTATPAELTYRSARRHHWDQVAKHQRKYSGPADYYHNRLQSVYGTIVPHGSRVLEVGCGEGDLLASVKPSYGVGIDFSPEMVALARARHPDLSFIEADAHDFEISDSFDYIILSDLVNDVWDVQRVISRVSQMATSDTRIVLNFYNRLWESPLRAAATFGFARRALPQNWLTESDVEGFLRLCGLDVSHSLSPS